MFPLTPPLPLPAGVSEQQLFDFVTSVRVQDAPEAEMRAYGTCDFRRFVYTWGLARDVKGKCLELGGNPYFTTMLLKQFTDLDISLANYFGHANNGEYTQAVDYLELARGEKNSECFTFQHFNIENDSFPYAAGEFDLVVFAEIIEHLLNDPCKVLREIKRVLKPNGTLILTTPNVARLENVTRLISGANIYDPYSGYGPYGRHNREYNRDELIQLLRFEGYEPTACFTADVHGNNAEAFCEVKKIADLLKFRENDLGQYIFIKATASTDKTSVKLPKWLYRSYPEGELDAIVTRSASITPLMIRAQSSVRAVMGKLVKGQLFKTPPAEKIQGELQTDSVPSKMSPGMAIEIPLNLKNEGKDSWYGYGSHPVLLSYHWLKADGSTYQHDGLRTPLACESLEPGKMSNEVVTVIPPETNGRYQLVLTLVQEGVCWFEERGFHCAAVQVTVE
jgi:SAM-dependent methyltransferase